MEPSTPVDFADLLGAFDWVSAAPPMENAAYVSRPTGKTHWASRTADLEDALPEYIEDGSIYVCVPHKNDLDLGRALVLGFAEEFRPEANLWQATSLVTTSLWCMR